MPYIGRSTDGFGVRNRFIYLASSGATSVSGADANGATLTFTDGAYVDVYLNGVLLKAGTDYNTNTANTIASLSAMSANDEVTVVVYDVFTVADMVSATSGGTFNGAVTVTTTDNNPQLTLVSTDADAVSGPILRLYRNSSSPADNDSIAQVRFVGRNDNSQDVTFSRIDSFVTDVSDGTEDSDLTLRNMVGGTLYNMVNIGATEIVLNDESLDMDFRVESNGNTHRLFVDGGNDQVLLGTTASRTMYGITPTTFQEGLDHATSSIGLVRNSNDGNGGYFIFGKSKGTALGSSTVVASGNDLGSIVWSAADGSDMQSVAAMIVGGISDDVSPSANDVPGTLKFATANDGATGATHRMMIDQLGRIRVGSDGELDHRLVSQQTTGVGTSATTIATVGKFSTFGGHYFITGRNADSSASRFCDQLTAGLNGSINVLHSTTVRGSPASRSYSLSSENLQVAMGSGSNYTINVFAIDHITS
jgi:hypothetical protein